MAADLGLVDRNDEKNKAMSILLNKSIPTGKQIDENFVNFIEWDGYVLLKSHTPKLPREFHETCYSDKTDCEATINHVHLETLSEGLDLIQQWEGTLGIKYPGRRFALVLSCDLDGTDATARFFQRRDSEPQWVLSDLESYKHGTLLVREFP